MVPAKCLCNNDRFQRVCIEMLGMLIVVPEADQIRVVQDDRDIIAKVLSTALCGS